LPDISPDSSTFTFQSGSSEIDSLEVGNVMIFDHGTGLLRVVTSVTRNGNQIIIITSQGQLTDVIEKGSIRLTKTLTPDDKNSGRSGFSRITPFGGNLKRNSDLFEIDIDDVVIYDFDGNENTTEDQVKADGEFSLGTSFTVEIDIESSSIDHFELSSTNLETSDLTIETGGDLSPIETQYALAYFTFQSIVVDIGIVPIYFTPILTINVGFDGDIVDQAVWGATQQVTYTAGLEYDDSGWATISDFSNSFDYEDPALTTYDPGTLDESATYYWQIVAHDDHQHSRSGYIWNFTTQ